MDLEKFIKKEKHLPGMPSAKDVDHNGVDLAQTQAALLKQIEELTLHVIELQKRVKLLEAANK